MLFQPFASCAAYRQHKLRAAEYSRAVSKTGLGIVLKVYKGQSSKIIIKWPEAWAIHNWGREDFSVTLVYGCTEMAISLEDGNRSPWRKWASLLVMQRLSLMAIFPLDTTWKTIWWRVAYRLLISSVQLHDDYRNFWKNKNVFFAACVSEHYVMNNWESPPECDRRTIGTVFC